MQDHGSAPARTQATGPDRSGALDDLDRALSYQAEAIDRLTAKLAPVTDPQHFTDLAKVADETRPAEQTVLRGLIDRVTVQTMRLERLYGDIDV